MEDVTGSPIKPAQAPLPEQVLKGKRAWWLYLIPIIAIAALPLVVVIGLFGLSLARVELSEALVTAVVGLASVALGGIVNQLLAGGTNGQ
jgi:hypothetical protein